MEELDGDAMIRRLVLGDAPSGSFTVRASRARLFGVRAAGLVVPVEWADGILRAGPLRGTLAGGAISGRLIAHTRAPPAYEGTLRLDDFDVAMLKEDLAPEGPAFTGRGSGWIRFENRGGSADDLLAQGQMRIRDGDLGELPGVANLQALLASLLQAPSRPRFERAYADFVLEKEVITFHRLHLAGPLFDMPGRGTVALDGTADLVFTPQILKSLLLPGSMQFPGVGPVLGAVLPEQVLYAVRIRGDLGRARPRLEPLPALGLSRGDDEFEGMGLPEPPARRIPHWFR